jgi:hypothetical protein
MVLTFTLGAGLIVKEGTEATTGMLLGILACGSAWWGNEPGRMRANSTSSGGFSSD